MKSEENRKPLAFTREELEAMQNHAEDDRLLFLLLRWTGLRPSEVIDLTWGEVSFDRQQIEYVQPKSSRKRIRKIPGELLSALTAEHQRRNPQQNEHVLQNAYGKPLTTKHLFWKVVELGSRSGVEHALPYRFRRTFAYEELLRVAQELGVNVTQLPRYLLSDAEQPAVADGVVGETSGDEGFADAGQSWHIDLSRNGVRIRGSQNGAPALKCGFERFEVDVVFTPPPYSSFRESPRLRQSLQNKKKEPAISAN